MRQLVKNKWVLVCMVVFIVTMVVAVVGILDLVLPNSAKNLYGNRLDGIEKYTVKEATINQIKDTLTQNNKVVEVKYDNRGKVLNFIITVTEETDKVSAQALTDKIISNFEENYKEFYDFQVFIKTEKESEVFPIIGYKHNTSLNFVWSNN